MKASNKERFISDGILSYLDNMKKINLCIVLLVFLFSSCVGSIQMTKMQPQLKFNNPVILDLKNYGDNDVDSFRRSEELIRDKLVNTSDNKFGYYKLEFDVYQSDVSWFPLVNGILFPLIPFGFPTDSNDISLYEKLYIFDSEGDLVKEYKKNDKFKQVAGLYYGYNPTRRATKRFAKMTDDIFATALLQSEEINQALKKKGPITEENKDAALKKINEYFNPPKSSSHTTSSSSGSSSNNFYSPPTYSPSTINSNSSSNESKIKTGKYACSGTDFTMSFSFGSVSMDKGYTTLAMGTYRISGNQLVITFTYEAGGGNELRGKTFSYTISDSKNFYLGNERWTYVGAY